MVRGGEGDVEGMFKAMIVTILLFSSLLLLWLPLFHPSPLSLSLSSSFYHYYRHYYCQCCHHHFTFIVTIIIIILCCLHSRYHCCCYYFTPPPPIILKIKLVIDPVKTFGHCSNSQISGSLIDPYDSTFIEKIKILYPACFLHWVWSNLGQWVIDLTTNPIGSYLVTPSSMHDRSNKQLDPTRPPSGWIDLIKWVRSGFKTS